MWWLCAPHFFYGLTPNTGVQKADRCGFTQWLPLLLQDGLRGHKALAGSGLFSMCGHAPQYPGNQKDHGEGFGAGGPTVFPQKTIEQGEQGFEHDHLPT